MSIRQPETPALRLVGDADGSVYIATRGGERLWKVIETAIAVCDEVDAMPVGIVEFLCGNLNK